LATFRKLPEEVRRTQILQAAAYAFSTDGYDKVSMARIAKDAGLTKGGVYFHFASKEEVFTAMVEAELTRRWGTLQEMAEELDGKPSVLALQEVLDWWFALDEGPNLLTPGILAACIAMDRPRQAFVAQMERVTDLLAELIGKLMTDLQIESDPRELAELLMMLRAGAIWKEATSSAEERERFHTSVTDVLGRLVQALAARRAEG
jgi:AcrR family transcriptional regulator